MITFAPEITAFINIIHSHGHQAYIVGGCVRDALIGKSTQDVDISTSASPEQLKVIFANVPITSHGEKYLSISVTFQGYTFQVTTFRKESEYTQHRFPKTTITSSLHEDIMRRDFTVNALVYNASQGLIDIVGGLDDINQRVIKTIGNPLIRFEEDGLRICRALRIASECQFSIEVNTYQAMIIHARLLRYIARERISDEAMKTLHGVGVNAIIEQFRQVFAMAFDLSYYFENIYLHHDFHPLAQWYSVFKSQHQPLETVIKLFAFHRKPINMLLRLDKMMSVVLVSDKVSIKRHLKYLSVDEILILCHIKVMTHDLSVAKMHEIMDLVQIIHDNQEPYVIAHLKIKGSDCLRLGMHPHNIARFLDACVDEVIMYAQHNTMEFLTNMCIEWNTKADH